MELAKVYGGLFGGISEVRCHPSSAGLAPKQGGAIRVSYCTGTKFESTMRIFHITSINFEGFIELKFDDSDNLKGFDFSESSVSIEQQIWFLQRLPANVNALGIFKKYNDSMTVTEVSQDVTFEMFWNRYDDKINSSKKKTKVKWNKMPAAEQVKAFRYISRYFAAIPSGTRKKYAETYLNAELWNN
jgi:hypothetical protein